jgi:hypothetical protein
LHKHAKNCKKHFSTRIFMQLEQLYVSVFVFLDGHHYPAKGTKGNQLQSEMKFNHINPIQSHIPLKYIFLCVKFRMWLQYWKLPVPIKYYFARNGSLWKIMTFVWRSTSCVLL